MVKKTTKQQAYYIARRAGVSFTKSAYQQKSSNMDLLTELAHRTGYRKPTNANASTGVYFFNHLKRLKEKGKL